MTLPRSHKEWTSQLLRVRAVAKADGRELCSAAQPGFVSYVRNHVTRIASTATFVTEQVTLGRDAALLEIGSPPYVLTAVLGNLIGFHVTGVTGRPWHTSGRDASADDVVTVSGFGTTRDVSCAAANVELDPLPYQDETFDVVLFTEVIEHLLLAPQHALREFHRVLKPHGVCIVSTPNAVSAKMLLMHAMNRNPASAYYASPYDRHNREYTLGELRSILSATGFKVARASLQNLSGFGKTARIRCAYTALNAATTVPVPYLRSKRAHVFVAALKSTRPASDVLPSGLFATPADHGAINMYASCARTLPGAISGGSRARARARLGC